MPDNKPLARRLYEEVLNQGNLAAADELIAPDLVDHEAGPDGPRGPETTKAFVAALRNGFSDLHVAVEDIIAEGDLVACRFIMTGTNTGDFMGMPATGRSVSVAGVDIMRFRDGKVTEHWGITDQFSLLQQLGFLPSSHPAETP
jgi:steroid delta-isomerase-like uncharacterized protein